MSDSPTRTDGSMDVRSALRGDLRQALDERGYAVIEDVIDPTRVLDPVLDAASRQLTHFAELAREAGQLPRTFASSSLQQQIIELARREVTWIGRVLDVSLPVGRVRETTAMWLAPEPFALLRDAQLLDLVSEVLGDEVWLSPVGHTRAKVPPGLAQGADVFLGDVPWHQDNGVLVEEADDVDILTVWIPLVDVDETNGCLQVVPQPRGSSLLEHCPDDGALRIPAPLLPAPEPIPLPMRRGSVLFMHSRTPHAALPNRTTDQVRLSMDLRYQAVPAPTGRPGFPSFLLRSPEPTRQRPTTFEQWKADWIAARDRLAEKDLGRFNRWDSDAPFCA